MEKHTVFLNFVPEDQAIAERIRNALNTTHIPVYVPPQNTGKDAILEITNQIEALAKNEGIMLVILSRHAIHNSLFISNIQYLCELTKERMALLVFQIEDLPGDNAVALYSSQAFLLRTEQDSRKDLDKIITRVERMLGIEEPPLLERFPITQKVIKRVFVWVAIFVFIVAIISYFFPIFDKKNDSMTQLTMEPFSGESVEQGLIVDRRFAPAYNYDGDPAAEAPFSYNPVYLFKTLTFDDPQYENLFDGTSMYESSANQITENDLWILKQSKGVFQISSSAQDNQRRNPTIQFNYYFDPTSTTYIGIRFRMEDYLGWTDVASQMLGRMGISDFQFMELNLNKQTMITCFDYDTVYDLEDDWHVVELVFEPETTFLTIYLDGMAISSGNYPEELNLMHSHLWISNDMEATTEWVHFYVDEIRYGGEYLIPVAEIADQSAYHFSPDLFYYRNDFEEGLLLESIKENPHYIHVSDGEIIFRVAPISGNDFTEIAIEEIPLSEVNYVALKYRYFQEAGECANLSILIHNETYFDAVDAYIQMMMINCGDYWGDIGKNKISQLMINEENQQPDYWHSLEILLISPGEGEDDYHVQLWSDGKLVHDWETSDPGYLTAPDQFSSIIFTISGGHTGDSYLQIEIDEIVLGKVFPNAGNG